MKLREIAARKTKNLLSPRLDFGVLSSRMNFGLNETKGSRGVKRILFSKMSIFPNIFQNNKVITFRTLKIHLMNFVLTEFVEGEIHRVIKYIPDMRSQI